MNNIDKHYSYDVFISHSILDNTWINDNLVNGMKKAGLNIFIDNWNIISEVSIPEEASDNLTTSKVVIFVITDDIKDSQWFHYQLQLAISLISQSNHLLKIIPILREEKNKTQSYFPECLEQFEYVEFLNDDTNNEKFQYLMDSITNYLSNLNGLHETVITNDKYIDINFIQSMDINFINSIDIDFEVSDLEMLSLLDHEFEEKPENIFIILNILYKENDYSLAVSFLSNLIDNVKYLKTKNLINNIRLFFSNEIIFSDNISISYELDNWLNTASGFKECLINKTEFKVSLMKNYDKNTPLRKIIHSYKNFYELFLKTENTNLISIQLNSLKKLINDWNNILYELKSIEILLPTIFYNLFSFIPELIYQIEILLLVFEKLLILKDDDIQETHNKNFYEKFSDLHFSHKKWPTFRLYFKNKVIQEFVDQFQNNLWLSETIGKKVSEKLPELKTKKWAKKERVTVLFCDLRGFTPLTEKLNHPQGRDFLAKLINKYLETSANLIDSKLGMIKEFTGDGFLAVFGLNVLQTTQDDIFSGPLKALEFAFNLYNYITIEFRREMISLFNFYNYLYPLDFSDEILECLQTLEVGFGIDYGPVIFGEIGNFHKKSFTLLGNIVNTASRLESRTKVLPGFIIFTDEFYQALLPDINGIIDNQFLSVYLKTEILRGQEKDNKLYSVIKITDLYREDIEEIIEYNEIILNYEKNAINIIDQIKKYIGHQILVEKLNGWDRYLVTEFFGNSTNNNI